MASIAGAALSNFDNDKGASNQVRDTVSIFLVNEVLEDVFWSLSCFSLYFFTPGSCNVEETDLLEILNTSVFPVVLIQIYFFFLKIDVFFGCGMSSLL